MYKKVEGKANPADLFTKALPFVDIERHLETLQTDIVKEQENESKALNMVEFDVLKIGAQVVKDVAVEIGGVERFGTWHRIDLGVCTAKTSMRAGPDWKDVVGRLSYRRGAEERRGQVHHQKRGACVAS